MTWLFLATHNKMHKERDTLREELFNNRTQDLMIWENLSLPRWQKVKQIAVRKAYARENQTKLLRVWLYNHSKTSQSLEGQSIKLYKRLLKRLRVGLMDSPQPFEQ